MTEESIEVYVRQIIKEKVYDLSLHVFSLITSVVILVLVYVEVAKESNLLFRAIFITSGLGLVILATIGFAKALEKLISTVVIIDMTDDKTAYERLEKIGENVEKLQVKSEQSNRLRGGGRTET
ncbi:MAG: hypothetical protein R3251_02480 [Candidatus Spechtbacterales bacterium]|nr:hypothetical protein [Candidatus Spechtbacterales bacterium]